MPRPLFPLATSTRYSGYVELSLVSKFSHVIEMIRPLIVVAVSILGISSAAFCGFALNALPGFLYLVDSGMYASFVAALFFYLVAAIAIGRLCVMLVSAWLGQLSVIVNRSDKNSRRRTRILMWSVMSRSPIALEHASIGLSLALFAFLYLGWAGAFAYFTIVAILCFGGFFLLYRFKKQVMAVVRPPFDSEELLKLIAEKKVSFTVSTTIAALAFSLGVIKAEVIFEQERVWICNNNTSFNGAIIGRSLGGLIVVLHDEEGDLQSVKVVEPRAEGFSFSATRAGCH